MTGKVMTFKVKIKKKLKNGNKGGRTVLVLQTESDSDVYKTSHNFSRSGWCCDGRTGYQHSPETQGAFPRDTHKPQQGYAGQGYQVCPGYRPWV
jgi:hypothetical protein